MYMHYSAFSYVPVFDDSINLEGVQFSSFFVQMLSFFRDHILRKPDAATSRTTAAEKTKMSRFPCRQNKQTILWSTLVSDRCDNTSVALGTSTVAGMARREMYDLVSRNVRI